MPLTTAPSARWLITALRAFCTFCTLLLPPLAQAQPTPFQGLRLLDQRGAAVTPASLRGRVLLLNFVYTGCSSTCPLQVRELADVQAALPAAARERVALLSVSVDPQNDTPATLAAFARRMGADRPGWRFATGTPQQLNLLLQRMRVLDTRKAQPGPEDHRTTLFLYDAGGELVQHYQGVAIDKPRLVREITQLVAAPMAAALSSTVSSPDEIPAPPADRADLRGTHRLRRQP